VYRHPQFTVGYHAIHEDVSLNYQMNRFSDGSREMVEAMTRVAPRIANYADFTRELLALSDDAFAQKKLLQAALYLRSAEFYMFPDDARKEPARRLFVRTMRSRYGIREEDHHAVPFGRGAMGAYRLTPEGSRGTLVLFGGFDSYIEELFATQIYFYDQGYDVIAFEGPGQGATLEESKVTMTPDWEQPVAVLLDYFRLDDVTLIGYSLGGCLALRAAAREPRIRRVICDDILTDFAAAALRLVAPAARAALKLLFAVKAKAVVNAVLARAMRRSLVLEWGMRQGIHTMGSATAYDFLRASSLYETKSLSALVRQDVLLLAGSEDHYVPVAQFHDQVRWLTHVSSLNARLFTRQEQAQNHVHIGNTRLSLDVMIAWLEGLDARGPVPLREAGATA
jgi:pimeloyl-ACP methyl ester carboxylesterase